MTGLYPILITVGLMCLVTFSLMFVLFRGILRKENEGEGQQRRLVLKVVVFWISTGIALALLNSTLCFSDYCNPELVTHECSRISFFFSTIIPASLLWPTYIVSASILASGGAPLPLCCSGLALVVGIFSVYACKRGQKHRVGTSSRGA